MASLSAAQMSVEIDGKTYSLVEIPSDKSDIVEAQKEYLLGAIKLDALVDDLKKVGGFIRIAYNGVGAAGPKYTELQIEIQRLGYDVTTLCDKSAVTVAKFKRAAGSILVDLQATYQYLLDNLEEMAVETLSSVSKLAGDMAAAAMEMHDEFREEEKRVVVTLENTMRAKGKQAIDIQRLAKERDQLELRRTEQEKLMNDAAKLEQEAKTRRRECEHREDAAIREMGAGGNVFQLLANAVTSSIGLGPLFDTSGRSKEREAGQWKEKRIEALQKESEERRNRQEALGMMSQYIQQIRNCQTEESLGKAAEEALHQAIGSLKALSLVMKQAALFWLQMQEHCKTMAKSQFQKQVETAMEKYSDEKRLKVWTSNGFKIKAVEFYAGWVALHSVCSEYMEQIRLTQQDLYRYIRENPTYEESRKNVHVLAAQFAEDLQQAQEAIEKEQTEAKKKIQDLSKPEVEGANEMN